MTNDPETGASAGPGSPDLPQTRTEDSRASSAPIIQQKHRYFPGFGQAILMFLAMICLQVILTIPFVLFGLYRHPSALALPTLIGSAVAIVYGYSKNFAQTGDTFREVFPFTRVSVYILPLLLITAVGLFVVNLSFVQILQRIVPPPGMASRFLVEIFRSGPPWITFVTVALISPVSEEFLFRGMILHAFLARYGPRKAIIASAVLFALMHGNPWQFCTGFLSGLLLAWCFVRTRSLIPCFFVHIANNSIAFLLPRVRPHLPVVTSWMTRHPAWISVAGVTLLISGLCLLYLFSEERPLVQASENAGETKC